MERPLKRIRISDPEMRSPRDPGSQMAEGLFTSEMGIRSDDSDKHRALPTPTINLADFQRRGMGRPPFQRRNAAHNLVPRAPAVTVTANVVEVNVGDGTATSAATTITAVSSDTVVSLEELGGSLTVPALSDVSAVETSVVGTILTDDQSTITTPPPTPLPSDSTSIGSSSSLIESLSSESSQSSGNSTLSSSSSESTVTVTATSTIDFAYQNGTFITTSFSGRATQSITQTHSSFSTGTAFGIGVDTDSSSDSASSTFYGAGASSPSGSSTTSSGSAASSSSSVSNNNNNNGPGLTPTQTTVVGGVVGGVAGLAIVLLLLLVFLRWYRRRLKSRGELPEQIAQRNLGMDGPSHHHHTMSERWSGVPLTAALAASLRKFRPSSSHTTGTNGTMSTLPSTMPETERGFQRIAGRKIAPVLSTGGDGFGGNYGAFSKEVDTPGPSRHTRNERSLAGSSFYRDSNGFYGGRGDMPSSPTTAFTSSPPQNGPGTSSTRDFAGGDLLHPLPSPSQVSLPHSRPDGMAALRPSPARTPVTVSPAASSIRLPIQQQPAMDNAPPLPPPPTGAGLAVPGSRDAIGRSLASQDGSRVSRSSGRSRFAEQM